MIFFLSFAFATRLHHVCEIATLIKLLLTRKRAVVGQAAWFTESKRLKTEKERCLIRDIMHKCTLTLCIKSGFSFFLDVQFVLRIKVILPLQHFAMIL